MGLASFTSSKKYKVIMSKLYGWGASIVIIGALFKINHYPYADEFLIVGLSTEAIIFFFSALEPIHMEPDWTLVYPELTGMAHDGKPGTPGSIHKTGKGTSVTRELDDMFTKAKIDPELIESLGDGMRKMSDNVSKMSNVASTGIAADDFVKNIKDAGKSAGELSTSYKRVSDVLQQDATTVGEFSSSVKSAAVSAGTLANVYNDVSSAIRREMSATETFSNSMSKATESANRLAEKYNASAELLSKSAEKLNFSALDNKAYSARPRHPATT